MQAINYESRATRSYSSSSVTLCVVRFESDLTFSFRPFASDLRRRNLSKKETNKLEFAYEHIFLLKNYYCRLSALQVVIKSCFFFTVFPLLFLSIERPPQNRDYDSRQKNLYVRYQRSLDVFR